jgi:hypothetical protein
MPVKFLTDLGVTRGENFSPLVTSSLRKKILRVKKTEMGSTTKKIQNPEWRTYALLRFFSLTGGLIEFFMVIISILATWFEFPLKPLPHQKFYRRWD